MLKNLLWATAVLLAFGSGTGVHALGPNANNGSNAKVTTVCPRDDNTIKCISNLTHDNGRKRVVHEFRINGEYFSTVYTTPDYYAYIDEQNGAKAD